LKTIHGNEQDLWQKAAVIDRSMRYKGAEATNILIGHGTCPQRPAIPDKSVVSATDNRVTYVGVQYARYWGAVGRNIGTENSMQLDKLKKAIADIKADGLSIGQMTREIYRLANSLGLNLAEDIFSIGGIGLDPSVYPRQPDDFIRKGMVLQVVLAVDASYTSFTSDVLFVKERDCEFLT
jgi:hypothetical protein